MIFKLIRPLTDTATYAHYSSYVPPPAPPARATNEHNMYWRQNQQNINMESTLRQPNLPSQRVPKMADESIYESMDNLQREATV
jgi:hypothetical protein